MRNLHILLKSVQKSDTTLIGTRGTNAEISRLSYLLSYWKTAVTRKNGTSPVLNSGAKGQAKEQASS
jgi:hypothetical protein